METQTDEIADGIVRLSTFVPDSGMRFNQFVITGDEPFLFHTGHRALFPQVRDALAGILPVDRLRWVSFGHVEADECGSLNDWLAAAPRAEVVFGALGCLISVMDLADRPPKMMNDGDVLELGDKRLRYLSTPHVPHGWDAGLWFEERTRTLLCGDLFTATGDGPAVLESSPVEAAIAAEEAFGYTALSPRTVPTIRALAALDPAVLALMHGPTHRGDGAAWLEALADYYETQLASPPSGD